MHKRLRVVPICSVTPPPLSNKKIKQYRNKIDSIDIKIVELLNKRATYSLKIGNEKDKYNYPVDQPIRESEIFQNLITRNNGPLDTKDLLNIYECIIDSSKNIQKDPDI